MKKSKVQEKLDLYRICELEEVKSTEYTGQYSGSLAQYPKAVGKEFPR